MLPSKLYLTAWMLSTTIISLCCGIVTLDRESKTIKLVHYTTQDFFERKQADLFPDAHEMIASACLKYINLVSRGRVNRSRFDEMNDDGDTEGDNYLETDDEAEIDAKRECDEDTEGLYVNEQGRTESMGKLCDEPELDGCGPLFSYAVFYFDTHARHCETSPTFQECVMNFLKNEDNRALFLRSWLLENDWGHKIRAVRAPGGDNPALCIAAVCGLQLITQKLIASGASVSARSFLSGWTPLHCAAASPCQEISGKLLRAGARIDDRTDKSKNTAHLAGNVQVFGILVESGADVNSVTNRGDTALHNRGMWK